jgi:hypothetical protein
VVINRAVIGAIVALVAVFGVLAVVMVLREPHAPVSISTLPRCKNGEHGATAPCVEVLSAVVVSRGLHPPPRGRRAPERRAELKLAAGGERLTARVRTSWFWQRLEPGDAVEAAVFAGRVIQLHHKGRVGDTVDNPVVRGRRHFLFLGALVLAAFLMIFELEP